MSLEQRLTGFRRITVALHFLPCFATAVGNALGATCGEAHFEIISGFRSPATNAMLKKTGGGVATHSLHMEGKAIDVRVPGLASARLRDAALSLGQGCVGYYPVEDFVHLDTGRVRSWGPQAG